MDFYSGLFIGMGVGVLIGAAIGMFAVALCVAAKSKDNVTAR